MKAKVGGMQKGGIGGLSGASAVFDPEGGTGKDNNVSDDIIFLLDCN